jgi:hypothetical protein
MSSLFHEVEQALTPQELPRNGISDTPSLLPHQKLKIPQRQRRRKILLAENIVRERALLLLQKLDILLNAVLHDQPIRIDLPRVPDPTGPANNLLYLGARMPMSLPCSISQVVPSPHTA